MKPIKFQDKQEKIFAAHIGDLFEIANEKYTAKFSGFLDLREYHIAQQVACAGGYDNFLFWGGYAQAERMMLGVFPPYDPLAQEQFPISPVTLHFRKEDPVGHRDILGSLMGLEIKREAVGDILVEEGTAVFFLTNTASATVLSELKKVGRWGVKVSEGLPQILPAAYKYVDLYLNVSSLRLDCLTSAVTGQSREKSAQLIKGGLVSVGGAPVEQVSYMVEKGDILSIRGFGKYLFVQVEKVTKKGRLQILCKKYS
ncbi:YlmH family RNA-binding protein [Youxingia wuxianensis]|uniref:RNA-binding protein n=1 Tax=Youxingia wuxianensis TaxID=2763678 RepID=A0A926EKN2_9FIRM|nr:YlmH/Sll1252 family protein [Youxingia wuxianensis]MBC8584336.1 RNA-binding protein [Youxingia wuxianensis]